MRNKISTIVIVLLCLFLGALEYFETNAPEIDSTSRIALCKMKRVQKRLDKYGQDIMLIARRVTLMEIDYRVMEREIEAAPAPEFLSPVYPHDISKSFKTVSVSSVSSVGGF